MDRVLGDIGSRVLDFLYDRTELLFALFLIGLPMLFSYAVLCLAKYIGWPAN